MSNLALQTSEDVAPEINIVLSYLEQIPLGVNKYPLLDYFNIFKPSNRLSNSLQEHLGEYKQHARHLTELAPLEILSLLEEALICQKDFQLSWQQQAMSGCTVLILALASGLFFTEFEDWLFITSILALVGYAVYFSNKTMQLTVSYLKYVYLLRLAQHISRVQ